MLVLEDKCVGCGTCANMCPTATINMIKTKNGEKANIDKSGCIHCGTCMAVCPHDAIIEDDM